MNAPADLLDLYRATHYDVRMPGARRVSLRVDGRVPLAFIEWANDTWPLSFISACNPRSTRLSAKENHQRMQALLKRLRSQQASILAGVGHIPGQPWREPSLLVAGLTIEQLDSLAIDFDQNAIVIARNGDHVGLRIYRPEWAPLPNWISAIEGPGAWRQDEPVAIDCGSAKKP